MTAAAITQLIASLIGVLAPIIFVMLGSKSGQVKAENTRLKEEAKLKDKADEAENDLTADLNARSLRQLAAADPRNNGPVQRS